MELESIDVNIAFRQGDLKDKVYVEQLGFKEFCEKEIVCQSMKSQVQIEEGIMYMITSMDCQLTDLYGTIGIVVLA